MIRGPVLPQLREHLWTLVSSRLGTIETGMALVLESLDCSNGQLGPVDGLARDAAGAPVLVLIAVDGDALLGARAVAAGEFVRRVGDGLVRAVPEADFCPEATPRVLVVGTESTSAALQMVARMPIPELAVCCLEPFRVAGSERFAVRWLTTASPSAVPEVASTGGVAFAHPQFTVPPARAVVWERLREICTRLDPSVQLSGDRYSQRILWRGQLLGEVRADDGALVGSAETGVAFDLRDLHDVRRFGDQLLRCFVRRAGLDRAPTCAPARAPAGIDEQQAAAHSVAAGRSAVPSAPSLRASLAAARLSPEEFSAFGESASWAGEHAGGIRVAEERDQASSAKGAPPSAGRPD